MPLELLNNLEDLINPDNYFPYFRYFKPFGNNAHFKWETSLGGDVPVRDLEIGGCEPLGLPALPVTFRGDSAKALLQDSITPHNKLCGWPITDDDYNLDRRREKLTRLAPYLFNPLPKWEASFYLNLNSDISRLNDAGLLMTEDVSQRFKKEYEILQRLRINIRTMGIEYQAYPYGLSFSHGRMYAGHFYPSDKGPLAFKDKDGVPFLSLREGFHLFLPDNPLYVGDLDLKFTFDGFDTLEQFQEYLRNINEAPAYLYQPPKLPSGGGSMNTVPLGPHAFSGANRSVRSAISVNREALRLYASRALGDKVPWATYLAIARLALRRGKQL